MANNGAISKFLLTPLREGRPVGSVVLSVLLPFLLTPLREGRRSRIDFNINLLYFYSRPCGRGDAVWNVMHQRHRLISTHAPAGGATCAATSGFFHLFVFLLTPLREGRQQFSTSPS